MSADGHRALAESVEGTSHGDFSLIDWGQLVAAAMIFGSAFLWIALALRSFSPETLSFGRVLMGAAAVSVLPAARCAIRRVDWPRLALASVVGIAAPVFLFALAEERIPSALAGMLVSAIPIMTAAVAAIETRTWPTRNRLTGLAIGFIGIVLLVAPDLSSGGGEAVGVVMVLIAVLSYAIASTLYAPLQQTYGALRVTLWLLILSTVMLLPLGVLGLSDSSIEPLSTTALVILGVAGTGVVSVLYIGLVGRVGAVRSSIAGYLIPIVALLLGVVFLNEQIEWVQAGGVAVALAGGYILSRGAPDPAAADAVPIPAAPHADLAQSQESPATEAGS